MSDHLITSAPGLTTCSRCGAHMYAATVGGLDRHIDTVTLNTSGQLRALQAGLSLFLLRGNRIYTLSVEHIRDGADLTVFAEHSCRPIPSQFIDGTHMGAAVALAVLLLGATPVDTEATPPY